MSDVTSLVMNSPVLPQPSAALSGLTELPEPALIYQRITSLLYREEPNPRRHASTLANALNVDKKTVSRWSSDGVRNVEDMMAICQAFAVPPSVLLAPVIQGTQMVDCLISVNGTECQGRAWISLQPLPTDKASAMVCRPGEGRFWRLEACGSGPRETAHVAYYVDSLCETRKTEPRIAVCLPGRTSLSNELAVKLQQYHCQTVEYASGTALLDAMQRSPLQMIAQSAARAMADLDSNPSYARYEATRALLRQFDIWHVEGDSQVAEQFKQAPNLLIVHESLSDWPVFVQAVRAACGRYVPALVLCAEPGQPRLIEGHYFCSIQLADVLGMIRRLV